MFTVTKFVLNNGQEFNTEKEAKKALENLYGNNLESLAHKLCRCNGKYSEILKCLEENIYLMQDILGFYDEMNEGLNNRY